ncbi:hypothetical protein SAMN05428949_5554 [Chitinophaga sp. YR627]|uniref:hypothetical protein n=1 Tax=Chitinophaga sp. YR627 TaxID=1881041 RepID=UPI0008DFEB32|nr:hypothetical protein [Chitinophaga sp. YR627]SFO52215.1 hypothetical protein SAMN05428949_5554 [Chitinophaga sp. YR627]
MEKPVHIPEGAVYNEQDKEWLLGETNEKDQRIGLWRRWHQQGYLWVTIEYGDGAPPYHVQRFHADGTLAEESNWYGGAKFLGTVRIIKSDHPTIEPFPPGGADKAANVWIAEFDYVDEAIYEAQRYFDRQRNPVSSDGDPLPERPATVPARAHFVRNQFGAAYWVMGTVDIRRAGFIGEYFEWDLDGNYITKRQYSTAGAVIENHEYTDGKLYRSNEYNQPEQQDLNTTYYYTNVDTPVVKSRTVYRKNKKDVEEIFFDKTGQQLYSTRKEDLSEFHKRRYYNGALVCEAFLCEEDDTFPASVKYYAAGGQTLIDLTAIDNDNAIWRLYDETGKELRQITVAKDDDERYKLTKWNAFMPVSADYSTKTNNTDWEIIVAKFNRYYDQFNTSQRLQELEVPAYLQTELDKIDWETIGTAMGGGSKLPLGIKGLLSEDEAIVKMSNRIIWMEIEHQESVYESTYKVSVILARMVPHYDHLPEVQMRLCRHLYDVLDLTYISEDEDLYEELIHTIKPLESRLLQMAVSDEQDTSRMAKYILAYTGSTATEAFLMAEWQNTEHISERRGYAVYSLSDFYALRQESDKLIDTFATAFATEPNAFVRFVMAAQLTLLKRKDAQDVWLSELLQALTNHEAIEEDYGNMIPFIGGIYDIKEYILIVLRKSRPETLENNIEPMIAALPTLNWQQQLTYLRTIFAVLFKNEDALEDITPIRKKALLAAADAVAQDPGFINRKEVFDAYGVPHDVYKLRQLAQ